MIMSEVRWQITWIRTTGALATDFLMVSAAHHTTMLVLSSSPEAIWTIIRADPNDLGMADEILLIYLFCK